ncbi:MULTISPECIES: hypothetical protein [unclassified Streptomyces]|uniref:hypothetical protein n=1 Tax=unclassified Streptomyces TaxID=2593676 RepID=UPI00340584F2
MSAPGPFLVIPATLWTVAAAASLIAAIALSVRTKRRGAAPDGWNPFGAGFPVTAMAAITGYAVAVVATDRFYPRTAAFSVLWPAMAAVALAHVAGRRARGWPQWATAAFAAVGAGLYGALPI